ncbi:PA3496 family putative envelope integrity protein [Mangrovitalea sediminis]|uniref:PA3496 family putative envelope integrity protein n=1 Tax=Mangrovitalea sediminis TaxID=1982043 RepID=UPI000BE5BE4B|nr:hypothetical protein [Mangrovitalea sediminis]
MYSDHNTPDVQVVQAELLDIFMDLHSDEARNRDKSAAKRRLAARRAIEQHFERKELERQINDYWADD